MNTQSERLVAVDARPGTRVIVNAAEVIHRCPHVDEVDRGTAVIQWTTTDRTLELHALRRWLNVWACVRVSHEDLVQQIADAVAVVGVADVEVQATYETAGMEVTVGAVPHPAQLEIEGCA